VVAGGSVSIFGQNLTGGQVSLNDVPLATAFSNATQINLLIPPGFPAGPATLKVTSASGPAFPILLQIDAPPPVILAVNTQANVPLAGASAAAAAGDILQVMLSGIDASVLSSPGRLRVTVSGMEMTVQQIAPFTPGVYQVQIVVNQSFGGSQVPLVVWMDGVASAPVNITVR
jgi:uncharacterized protein (TIGR03437 family)